MPSKVSPLENRLDGDRFRGRKPDANGYIDYDEDIPYKHVVSVPEKILNYLLCRGDLNNQQLEIKPVSLWGLLRFGSGYDKFCFFIGCLCAIVSGCSQPAQALVAGRIANVLLVYPATTQEFVNAAYENVYIFLGMGGLMLILHMIQYMCFHGICHRVILRLRREFMRAILRQNAGWFDKQHSGALVSKLNDNMERIHEGIGDKLGLLIRGGAMFLAAMAVAFAYEWRIALLMLGVAPCTCMVMSLMARKMGASIMAEMGSVGKAGALAEEAILGVRTVQSLNGQPEMVARYENQLNVSRGFALWKGFWSGFFGGLFYFVLFSFMGVGMLYGGYLLSVGIVAEPGEVFICVMSMLLGAYFLGMISPHLMVLLNARAAAATIYAVIDRKPIIDVYSQGGSKPDNIKGRVVLENVHFRYPSRKETKTVALVGHSGCGKSTSIGLVTRLYMPESGRVSIDGHDVNSMNLEYLRNIVGVVQQEPVLFNATIADNLRMGLPSISKEQMLHVCKMANAHDFIAKLPQGYDTLIGDGGVQLSGGQKQRVAIARTLARDPKVLLLDEATSALDAQSEGIVQEALNKASKGRATIVIAHRLSTIKDADKIVYIDKGLVAESGTHEELVRLGGKYYELVKAQQFIKEGSTDEGEEIIEEDIPLDDEVIESEVRSQSTISRVASLRSGREAFQRGMYDSLRGSTTSGRHQAEDAIMAEEAMKLMNDDEISAGGIGTAIKNAKGHYGTMVLAVVLGCIRGMELPALSLLFGYVFEAFTFTPWGADMMHRLCMAVICFGAVGVGTMIFQLTSSICVSYVSENLQLKFRVMSFRSILYQDAAYFDNPAHTAGKLITRLATDAPNMSAFFDSRMLQIIYAVSSIIVCIAIALGFSWPVGLMGILMILVLLSSMLYLAWKIYAINLIMVKEDEAGRRAIETIENVRTIQLLTREVKFFELYFEELLRQQFRDTQKGIFEAINFTISQTFMFFLLAVAYSVGIRVMHVELVSSDRTFRAIIALLLACVSIINSTSYFPEIVKAKSAAGLLFAVINRKPTTGDSSVGEKMQVVGNVTFEGVHFRYPQKPKNPVMRGLNLNIKRGTTVALVGPSGSGKSTIISMLERFYDPSAGFLKIDGKDSRGLSLDHLRTQMALVGQEPRLFSGTVRENICFGLGELPTERIMEALRLANAKFVTQLPGGLDTEVGEKGGQLSGGQKQRIAIARALVREPKILLLDEATSALDSESERAVQVALDAAREGRTCVTIAHRLSSIQNSDAIAYIENGKVREIGSHVELMALKGRYFKLIMQQDLSI
ncbi:hypothetical protein PFISCL1PPCAC_5233 [Pristionchus fissidentatus]|uniref:Uncharacterized protein n=1 Tax=Pristionchus fissidentatus TaxID=1538716 RepID=A0AAV5V2W4_9BILA|nr:hypothetical protein PFISCL1PPCAC_5233 [Pristionchus fissidentatus]